MAVNVNPPPQIGLPPELVKDKATRTYFQHLERMLLQLWKRTGGSDDLIDQANANYALNLSSSIFDIREQIGSAIPVTIDTTGFTVDTTEQTTDKTEQ